MGWLRTKTRTFVFNAQLSCSLLLPRTLNEDSVFRRGIYREEWNLLLEGVLVLSGASLCYRKTRWWGLKFLYWTKKIGAYGKIIIEIKKLRRFPEVMSKFDSVSHKSKKKKIQNIDLTQWVKLVNPIWYSDCGVTSSTWWWNGITDEACCPYPIRHCYTWHGAFLSSSHCWWPCTFKYQAELSLSPAKLYIVLAVVKSGTKRGCFLHINLRLIVVVGTTGLSNTTIF